MLQVENFRSSLIKLLDKLCDNIEGINPQFSNTFNPNNRYRLHSGKVYIRINKTNKWDVGIVSVREAMLSTFSNIEYIDRFSDTPIAVFNLRDGRQVGQLESCCRIRK